MVAEGDKIIVRGILRAIHKPTAKTKTTTRFTVCRFEGAQITEIWILNDILGIYQQFGVLPPDEEPVSKVIKSI